MLSRQRSIDATGQVLQTTATIAGLGVNVVSNEVWDILGRRTELRATVGPSADFKNNYTFDNLGRVTKITQQGQGGRPVANKRVEYSYNTVGEVTNLFRHSHLLSQAPVMETAYGRDNLGRMTSMVHRNSPTNFAIYLSSYDAANRLTTSSRSTAGSTPGSESVSYNHDNIGQLTAASHSVVGWYSSYTETYSYDANGNRTGASGASVVPTLNNRIYRDGTGYEYVYDAEGNIVSKKVIGSQYAATHYVYDHRNRMTRAYGFNAAGSLVLDANYSYDAFNRRVKEEVDPDGYLGQPTTTTYSVYDTDDVILVLTAGGTHSNRYLHGPAVDEVLADENTQSTLWALAEKRGQNYFS